MKVHPLLVRLDDVAPVEEVVVVYHAAGKVGLAQHLIYELATAKNILEMVFLQHVLSGRISPCEVFDDISIGDISVW